MRQVDQEVTGTDVPWSLSDGARGRGAALHVTQEAVRFVAVMKKLNGLPVPGTTPHVGPNYVQGAGPKAAPGGPKTRAVYHQLADEKSHLSHGAVHLLSILLRAADRDCSNSFLSRKTMARRLGRSVRCVTTLLKSLKDEGWIVRERIGLFEHNPDGTFASTVGVQFCIPPNVITANAPGWSGPWRFEKREEWV